MDEIKNVIICGLGGLGCICASSVIDSKSAVLKILVDKERFERYKKQTTFFNSKPYNFELILPEDNNFKTDLVIIATKNNGLNFAINGIKNFVHEDTVFISLLNGIHSEVQIAEKYGWKNTLISFYIGHSCIREGRNITNDGIYNLIIGKKDNNSNEALNLLCNFFVKSGIKYRVSDSIKEEYWRKFLINVGINQLSAVTDLNLKEIKRNEKLVKRLKDLMKEAAQIAEKENIKNPDKIYNSALSFLLEEIEDAKPSMQQDIEAGRTTELDIFAGEIIKLAKKHNLSVPENEKIYKEIKEIEKRKIPLF